MLCKHEANKSTLHNMCACCFCQLHSDTIDPLIPMGTNPGKVWSHHELSLP